MKILTWLIAVVYCSSWLVVVDIIPKKIKYSDYLELVKKGNK